MIAGLKPYPEYKDSGVPWLGRIPSHWTISPGRAVFAEKQVKNTEVAEKRVLSLSYGRIVIKPEEKLRGLVPGSFATYQIVEPGDVIIRATDLQNDHTSLRVGLVRDRGIITAAYLCLRGLGPLTPEFGYLLLHTYDVMKTLYGLGSGLRQNLSFKDIKYLPITLPPPEEQLRIASFVRFVDEGTATAIREKRKLIALLNEEKQVIIEGLVARGSESSEPRRIAHVSDLITGYPFPSSGFTQSKSDVRLLRGINVTPGAIRWDSVVRWPESNDRELQRFRLEAGDIVFGMDRPIVGKGIRVAVLTADDVPSLLLQRVARLRPHSGISREFLLLVLTGRRFRDYLAPIFTGISVPHVSPQQIGKFKAAFPPFDEQCAIVNAIAEKTLPLDASIDRMQHEINLIREYRTRLIADVVTGQLDVRAAAEHLPAETEEPEAAPEPDADEEAEDLLEEVSEDA